VFDLNTESIITWRHVTELLATLEVIACVDAIGLKDGMRNLKSTHKSWKVLYDSTLTAGVDPPTNLPTNNNSDDAQEEEVADNAEEEEDLSEYDNMDPNEIYYDDPVKADGEEDSQAGGNQNAQALPDDPSVNLVQPTVRCSVREVHPRLVYSPPSKANLMCNQKDRWSKTCKRQTC